MLFALPSVVIAAILLLAMVLNLSVKPSFSAKLTATFLFISVAGGLLMYGVGFAETTGDLVQSIIRTPLAVFRMFMGINELSSISDSTLVSSPVGLVIFWLLHLLAFYSMASAAMFTLGAQTLRYLRLLLSHRGNLTLIYGINEYSISLGKECVAARDGSVVFIAEDVADSVIADLNNLGMSVLSGQDAVNSTDKIMRRLRVSNRKLSVYAMDKAEDKNLFYALKLKDALEKAGVSPENTRLTLSGEEEIIAPMLQVSEHGFGFGYVNVCEAADLAARAMIKTCPPWDFLRFGPDGKAEEDFECVVVGFGRFGQAALKQLVMNGQFAGSSFRAAVFSPNYKNESGYLMTDSPELFSKYDISFFSEDARSHVFYDYIHSRLKSLKIIAVCTGSDNMDREISDNLMLFLKRHQMESICVVRCGRSGARYQETVGSPILLTKIYTLDMLSAEKSDRAAILLNNVYDTSDRTPWEKWVACDTFSKMSSRASADFIPAFVRASGRSAQEIAEGDWTPDQATRQVLGETEHKRWNAFHYVMGYVTMSPEEFNANAEEYTRRVAAGEPANSRIAKNQLARTHACLIPWDDLDDLSDRENAVTGRGVDYKLTDINNVMALPQLLKAVGKDVSSP